MCIVLTLAEDEFYDLLAILTFLAQGGTSSVKSTYPSILKKMDRIDAERKGIKP